MAGSSHGHTPAAWTGVTIAFIGFCVAGAFMVLAEPLGFWAGMVIVVAGGVIGWIMSAMGLGMPKDAHKALVTSAASRSLKNARLRRPVRTSHCTFSLSMSCARFMRSAARTRARSSATANGLVT